MDARITRLETARMSPPKLIAIAVKILTGNVVASPPPISSEIGTSSKDDTKAKIAPIVMAPFKRGRVTRKKV